MQISTSESINLEELSRALYLMLAPTAKTFVLKWLYGQSFDTRSPEYSQICYASGTCNTAPPPRPTRLLFQPLLLKTSGSDIVRRWKMNDRV